jgi:chorismate mutase
MKTILEKKPLIIAGPCSAETEEQLISTAQELKSIGKVDVLRAGIWKPRTNPGGFEGVGVKGLSWLLRAKQETGLLTAVEVANSLHVEDALSFDVDIVWIGARTTVNPFSVQQIADALKGSNKTVLIKNPMHADLKLWIGAVDRIQKSGIDSVGLIHRGFHSYSKSEYRNVPMWQIPIEMKRIYPDLPMICDPSHICGNKTGLLSIAQKSIDLDYNGLMIETHIDPNVAWTDKQQQITPSQLLDLLNQVIWKKNFSTEEKFLVHLSLLREQINTLDNDLLNLLSSRMEVASEIGKIKKEGKITVLQTARYSEILEKAKRKGHELGLAEQFIQSIFEAIHVESIRNQNESFRAIEEKGE